TKRGIKTADVSVWTKEAGWQKILDNFNFLEAEGSFDYDEPTVVRFNRVKAQKVRFDNLVNLGDRKYIGLSEVKFFEKPDRAIRPDPVNGGALGFTGKAKLSWTPGLNSIAHKIYLGTEPNKLELLGEVKKNSFENLPVLKKRQEYYWRVDSMKDDGTIITGKLWKFSTGQLVAHYKFDSINMGITLDSSGNGLNGKLVGDADIISDPERGKVLSLDGNNDYVSCGNDARFNITYEITIAAWIKINLFGRDWKSIVTKADTAWRLQKKVNSYNLKFNCDGLEQPIPWPGVEANVKIDNNRWYYIVGVYDGNKLYIYLDGKLDNYEVTSGTIATNTCQVFIGNNAQYPNRFWNGLIDDVRIYNYALTKDEIQALYFEGLPEKATKPVPGDDESVGLSEESNHFKLSWKPGRDAIIHYIYFGINPNDMKLLNEVNDVDFIRSPKLDKFRCYYWRVDEEKPDGSVVEGNLWKFSTGGPLIGWWKFDEANGGITPDSSGRGLHGKLVGDAQIISDSQRGNVLSLDGDGDYVDLDNPSFWPAGTSARSMTGWAKTNTLAVGWRWIASYGSPVDRRAMFIGMNGDYLVGGGYNDSVQHNYFWEVGIWNHICLTYDGTTASLYANGVEVVSVPKSWNLFLSRARIARQVNDLPEFWDGQIDDVRIYNIALSEDEIKALYGDQDSNSLQ
ncbi:MAG: LamG domain-containing protein, partial [Planctomycetota bacterium]